MKYIIIKHTNLLNKNLLQLGVRCMKMFFESTRLNLSFGILKIDTNI